VFGIREKDLNLASASLMRVHEAHVLPGGKGEAYKERRKNALRLAQEFVQVLEQNAKEHPLQFFNFQNIWEASNGAEKTEKAEKAE
jgi:lauroyl/myristoyl acyltransferase